MPCFQKYLMSFDLRENCPLTCHTDSVVRHNLIESCLSILSEGHDRQRCTHFIDSARIQLLCCQVINCRGGGFHCGDIVLQGHTLRIQHMHVWRQHRCQISSKIHRFAGYLNAEPDIHASLHHFMIL